MSTIQRLKYRLACWLVGFDIHAASAVARRQGFRDGKAAIIDALVAQRNGKA